MMETQDVTPKYNEVTLRASALIHNIDVGEEESGDSIAGKLIAHFKSFNDNDLSTCRGCGLDSPPKLDPVCPFCGAGDDAPTETVSTATTNGSATEARMNTATETNGKSDKTKTKGKDKLADVTPKTSKLPKQTLVKTTPTRTLVSPAKLDEAVARVIAMKAASAVGMWALGHFIRVEIFEKELWKLRTDKDGKVEYTGFNTFALAELGMTSANAYKLMDVSKEFTEAQVGKFGPTKLGLILQAPETERKALVEGAEKKSTKQVKKDVAKAKAKHNVTGKRKTGRKEMPSGGGRKATTAPKAFVAMLMERRRVEMFTKTTIKDEKPKHAKRVVDVPTGYFDVEGTRVHLTIQQTPAGELVVIFEPKEIKA